MGAVAPVIYLTFGPSIVTIRQGISGIVIPITIDALNNGGIVVLQNIEHMQVVAHASSSHLTSMNHLDLSRFPALRSLTFYVVFDTLDSTCVVRAWTGILAAVRTIPRISHLEHFTLCSPASQAIMRSGSALFHALEQPLYSLDRCLAALVDRAPLRVVTLVPPQGEEFISSDWIRARSFFSALWDYDMLAF